MIETFEKFIKNIENITIEEPWITGDVRPGREEEQADVLPLELHFEQNFSNVYGINALGRIRNQLQKILKTTIRKWMESKGGDCCGSYGN